MTIKTIEQAEAELAKFVPLVAQLPGEQMTLDRIAPLMDKLGRPQENLKVIHIAGTSGKTSTAYYLSAMLSSSGQKVGLTVSPHILTVRERVQINNEPLDEKLFCDYLSRFLQIVYQQNEQPTYFELMYAFAIWVFAEEKVDYAVVETGLGGLYDATNVVTNPDKVCIISDIGLDHMHILGNTIEEIATQKAGIIHPSNKVLLIKQNTKVNMLIKKLASERRADFEIVEPESSLDLLRLPSFQKRNFSLAYSAFKYLAKRDEIGNLTSQDLVYVATVVVPARFDLVKDKNKQILFDGAHNSQKLEAFIQSYRETFPNSQPLIIFAFKDGKNPSELIELLLELSDKLVMTTFDTTQDLPVKSIDPELYLDDSVHSKNVRAAAREEAVKLAIDPANREVIVTGSFYLISQIKPMIMKELIK